MNNDSPLFGNCDPQRIEQILRSDWERFSAVAFFVLGQRDKWEAAVKEALRVWRVMAFLELETELFDKLFDLLFERLLGARNEDGFEDRMKWFFTTLQMPMPSMVRRMREQASKPPDQIQHEKNREWLRAYRAGELNEKPQTRLKPR